MDLINNRTKDITAMALDGLYERSKAISANTANALTPNYQRKEVSFEGSLREVIRREDEKESIKMQNSAFFKENPAEALKSKSPAEIAFLSSMPSEGFNIDIETDTSEPIDSDGNNVSIEREMMDEAKNGLKYQVLAALLSRQYSELRSVISGENES